MLKVYGWYACPHCLQAVEWLKKNNIPFEYYEMDDQPLEVVNLITRINGGDDWVVPTLEYNGKWRPGEVFDADKFRRDLIVLGVPMA